MAAPPPPRLIRRNARQPVARYPVPRPCRPSTPPLRLFSTSDNPLTRPRPRSREHHRPRSRVLGSGPEPTGPASDRREFRRDTKSTEPTTSPSLEVRPKNAPAPVRANRAKAPRRWSRSKSEPKNRRRAFRWPGSATPETSIENAVTPGLRVKSSPPRLKSWQPSRWQSLCRRNSGRALRSRDLSSPHCRVQAGSRPATGCAVDRAAKSSGALLTPTPKSAASAEKVWVWRAWVASSNAAWLE